MTTLRVRRLASGEAPDPVSLPTYQSAGAAGLDVCAAVREVRIIAPGERALIPSGFAIAVPRGHEAQVRPRSGRALREGLTVANAPGTIDEDYRGEVGVILINLGSKPVTITRGDRIAQLVIAPVTRVVVDEVESLEGTQRGSGGFGHTGD
jgi:dUTP pyrophosphatase